MIVPYDVHSFTHKYNQYYENQVGKGFGVFRGSTMQRVAGIRSLLTGAAKSLAPLLKSATREFISSGINVARDVLRGENAAESAS